MGRSRGGHGEITGRARGEHGEIMGGLWGEHGEIWGEHEEIMGRSMGDRRELMRRSVPSSAALYRCESRGIGSFGRRSSSGSSELADPGQGVRGLKGGTRLETIVTGGAGLDGSNWRERCAGGVPPLRSLVHSASPDLVGPDLVSPVSHVGGWLDESARGPDRMKAIRPLLARPEPPAPWSHRRATSTPSSARQPPTSARVTNHEVDPASSPLLCAAAAVYVGAGGGGDAITIWAAVTVSAPSETFSALVSEARSAVVLPSCSSTAAAAPSTSSEAGTVISIVELSTRSATSPTVTPPLASKAEATAEAEAAEVSALKLVGGDCCCSTTRAAVPLGGEIISESRRPSTTFDGEMISGSRRAPYWVPSVPLVAFRSVPLDAAAPSTAPPVPTKVAEQHASRSRSGSQASEPSQTARRTAAAISSPLGAPSVVSTLSATSAS